MRPRPVSRLFALLLALPVSAQEPAKAPQSIPKREPAPLETLELEGVRPVSRVGSVLLAGQPTAEALSGLAGDGATVVVDLRRESEARGYDEPALADELGLRYVALPFGGDVPLTDDVFWKARLLLADHAATGEGDLLLHCAGSTRVGAVWLAARTLDEAVPLDVAVEEARRVGLGSPSLEARVLRYVLGGGHLELGELAEQLAAKRPDVPTVDVLSLARELEGDGPKPVLLDVREPEEYIVSHLPEARRARDLAAAREALGEAPLDTPIVAYCSVGARSGELATDLRDAGYTNVRNLSGSIFAWANAGLPLDRAGAPALTVHPFDARWGRYLRRDLWAPLEEK